MTALTPLVIDGEIVPGQFVDNGEKERGYVECMWNGERVYMHESGYGLLHQNQVTIKDVYVV